MMLLHVTRNGCISAVNALDITDRTIRIGNKKIARFTSYDAYCSTLSEAHEHFVRIAQREIEKASQYMELAQERLAEAMSWRAAA